MNDYIIKGGLIIDGTGRRSSLREDDIAIKGHFISAIGNLSGVSGQNQIDARGLCISPGFIDVHSHSELTLLADGRAEGKVCQGVTTEVSGNCGFSAAPMHGAALEQRENDLAEFGIKHRWSDLSEYFRILESSGIALNFATLVGHGSLRASVAGYSDRSLTVDEKKRILEMICDAMRCGALGLSTGLIYPPGIYSDTDELVDLAKATAMFNGIYTTHMRSEGSRLIESIEEVIRIAERAGIHAHISHLKTSGRENWGKIEKVISTISFARENGLAITCDRYPYIASSTDLDAILPAWAFEGGRKHEIRRLRNEREKLRRSLVRNVKNETFWDNISISSLTMDENRWMEGKSISEISRNINKDPLDLLFDLLIEEKLGVGAVFFVMSEENLKAILSLPFTMIGSDSSARSFSGITASGVPHPRGFGSFPRVLGRYVRERGLLSIEEAVYRMTGLPARVFRIARRGTVEQGYYADLVIFDPDKVNDTAEFTSPFSKPVGIHYVFVNGQPVVFEGKPTGNLPGMVVRKNA